MHNNQKKSNQILQLPTHHITGSSSVLKNDESCSYSQTRYIRSNSLCEHGNPKGIFSSQHKDNITLQPQTLTAHQQKCKKSCFGNSRKPEKYFSPSELTSAESLLNIFNAALHVYLMYACKPLLCICIFAFLQCDVK